MTDVTALGSSAPLVPALVATAASVALVDVLSCSRLRFLPAGGRGLVLRLLIRIVPFLLPLLVLTPPSLDRPVLSLIVAAGLAVPALASQHHEIRRGFSGPMLALLGPVAPADKRYLVALPLVSAVAQEVLYRYAVLATVEALAGGLTAVVVAALLFVAEHVLPARARSRWTRKDIAVHVYLSVAGGVAALSTGSVLPALALHLAYNLPLALQSAARATDDTPVQPARPARRGHRGVTTT
jgi:membrane protease YdiL (CAAX protease family)